MRAPVRIGLAAALVAALLALGVGSDGGARAAACRFFPETGKSVCGPFLAYWEANGALAQQGYPLTDEFIEINPTDGNPYRTQYFERARFEHHPEHAGTRYEVLLGLLGREQFAAKYPAGAPSLGHGGDRCFPETGFCTRGRFYDYWIAHGGLAQQGLPISPEFLERNPTDGREYLTQYFERARFEHHPEIGDPQFQVLLGLLGREQLLARYPGGEPGAGSPLRLEPAQVNFGFRAVGSSAEIAVGVSNAGPVPVGLADVQLLGPGAAAFSVRARSCAGAVLPPGGGCTLGVYFAPEHPADYQATLVLVPTAGAPAVATLTGLARPAP